jgi:hypothetical protein
VLLTAVPFLRRMTWRSPDTYHLAGNGRGTATLKFYEGRDILQRIPHGLMLAEVPSLADGPLEHFRVPADQRPVVPLSVRLAAVGADLP